jgi:hypothetical protein
MDSNMKLFRTCAWEEVFLTWYESEGKNPDWLNLAKERGYASWADWRINGYARRFDCAAAKWGFYEISNPGAVISFWFGGPFRTWIEKYYGGEETETFGELSSMPDIFNHTTVKSMVENYPKESIISALRLKDGRIFVVEGMHRSCALALMAKKGINFPHKLIFALGDSVLPELPQVGKNLDR